MSIADLFTWYSLLLDKHYYSASSISVATFCAIGDAIAQTLEITTGKNFLGKKDFDWRRNLRYAVKGLGGGLFWSVWYQLNEVFSVAIASWFLQSWSIPLADAETSGLKTVIRTISSIVLEQFVAAPINFAFYELPFLSILNGNSISSIPGTVHEKLGSLLVAHAKVWTVLNVLIYNVPVRWRLLVETGADVLFETLASSISSDIGERKPKDPSSTGKKKNE